MGQCEYPACKDSGLTGITIRGVMNFFCRKHWRLLRSDKNKLTQFFPGGKTSMEVLEEYGDKVNNNFIEFEITIKGFGEGALVNVGRLTKELLIEADMSNQTTAHVTLETELKRGVQQLIEMIVKENIMEKYLDQVVQEESDEDKNSE